MFDISKSSVVTVVFGACMLAGQAFSAGTLTGAAVKDDGTLAVPSFDLPVSTYASSESRDYVVQQFRATRGNLTAEAAREAPLNRYRSRASAASR